MTEGCAEDALFREVLRRELGREEVRLTERQVDDLATHYRLLALWNRRMNLTAIRGLDRIIRRHFLEGILAGRLLAAEEIAGVVVDLGSGNGFPLIPIRVARPEAGPAVLVESSRKRAAFLRALIRELDWNDSRVEVRRVRRSADLGDLSCDIFVTRAVAPFGLIAEGLPFLRAGGAALFFLRRSQLEREVPTLPHCLCVLAERPLPGREAGLILLRKI